MGFSIALFPMPDYVDNIGNDVTCYAIDNMLLCQHDANKVNIYIDLKQSEN